MKIIARHKWVSGCTITESHEDRGGDRQYIRFTATIRGWRNWIIFEGFARYDMPADVVYKVMEIRKLIDSGDEKIFDVKGPFITQ